MCRNKYKHVEYVAVQEDAWFGSDTMLKHMILHAEISLVKIVHFGIFSGTVIFTMCMHGE